METLKKPLTSVLTIMSGQNPCEGVTREAVVRALEAAFLLERVQGMFVDSSPMAGCVPERASEYPSRMAHAAIGWGSLRILKHEDCQPDDGTRTLFAFGDGLLRGLIDAAGETLPDYPLLQAFAESAVDC